MKKMKSIISLLTAALVVSTSIAALASERDYDSYAAYLNNSFSSTSVDSFIQGDIYAANGDVKVQNITIDGSLEMNSAKKFTGKEELIGNGLIKSDDTSFNYALPTFPVCPTVDNYVQTVITTASTVISEDTYIGTLDLRKGSDLTIDLSKGDVTIVVDTLISRAGTAIVLSGDAGYANIYIKNAGTSILCDVNANGAWDQLNLTIESDSTFYASNSRALLNTKGSFKLVKGSSYKGIAYAAGTSVTMADTDLPISMTGYIYAPNASMLIHNDSALIGHIVANSLEISGKGRILYTPLLPEFVKKSPADDIIDDNVDDTKGLQMIKYDVVKNTFQTGVMDIMYHVPTGSFGYDVLDEKTFVPTHGMVSEELKQKAQKICEVTNFVFDMRADEVSLTPYGRVDSEAYQYALVISPYVVPYLINEGFDPSIKWLVWGDRNGNVLTVWLSAE